MKIYSLTPTIKKTNVDFVTVDQTDGNKLVTLYQVITDKTNEISPRDLEEYSTLFDIKDITINTL